jgi:hypothetical protein
MAGWNHDNANWKPKQCGYCAGAFVPKSGVHKFCSEPCKRRYRREFGAYTTEAQYGLINGRWDKYFSRLCTQKHRKGTITRDDCITILNRQQGRCALSGEVLTCSLNLGFKNPTNASLDRINPQKGYEPTNVQLVCAVLNSFRSNTPVEEFVDWCRKVATHAEKTQL